MKRNSTKVAAIVSVLATAVASVCVLPHSTEQDVFSGG